MLSAQHTLFDFSETQHSKFKPPLPTHTRRLRPVGRNRPNVFKVQIRLKAQISLTYSKLITAAVRTHAGWRGGSARFAGRARAPRALRPPAKRRSSPARAPVPTAAAAQRSARPPQQGAGPGRDSPGRGPARPARARPSASPTCAASAAAVARPTPPSPPR